MRHRRRRPMAALLLYFIQVVIVGRALAVGSESSAEVYTLCNTTGIYKGRTSNVRLYNTSFSNASFINDPPFFGDTLFFNKTSSFDDSAADCNKSAPLPPPAMDYEFSWVDVLFVGLMGTSGLVGTVGNAAVILAFCLYRKVRRTANVFILNTSIWDLITSAVTIPLGIHSMVTGQPNCGEACCAFIGFLHLSSISQSMLSCVLIAFSRFVLVMISQAFYKRLFGPVKAFAWVVGAWVITVVFISPAISGTYGSLGWDENWGECGLSSDDPKSPVFYRDVLGPAYWVIVVATFTIYITIYLRVRKSAMTVDPHLSDSTQQVSRQAIKHTKHMLYVFVTFFTLTAPCLVMISVDPYGTSLPKAAFVTAFALFYLNNAVNPIIYTWTLKEFRKAFKSMVRCRRYIVITPYQAPAPKPEQERNAFPLMLTAPNRVGPGPAWPSVAAASLPVS